MTTDTADRCPESGGDEAADASIEAPALVIRTAGCDWVSSDHPTRPESSSRQPWLWRATNQGRQTRRMLRSHGVGTWGFDFAIGRTYVTIHPFRWLWFPRTHNYGVIGIWR
jgi:hypothetical protein